MTVQEFQASAIERAGLTLAFFLEQTQADKQDWTPTVEGAEGLRSALNMVGECILVNRLIAGTLRGETPPPGRPMDAERPFTDAAEAGPMLIASAEELANAVRAMSDEDLLRAYPSRRGPMPGYILIEIPFRNMHYHGGQMNMLQLCYGDTEFRVPTLPKKD
jgi:hypothetical protein